MGLGVNENLPDPPIPAMDFPKLLVSTLHIPEPPSRPSVANVPGFDPTPPCCSPNVTVMDSVFSLLFLSHLKNFMLFAFLSSLFLIILNFSNPGHLAS